MKDLKSLREAVNTAKEAVNTAQERRAAAARSIEAASDDATLDAANAEFDLADTEVRSAQEDLKRREAEVDRMERIERAKDAEPLEIEKVEERAADKGVKVTRSEPVYHEESGSFFGDLLKVHEGAKRGKVDPLTVERLLANNKEVADRVSEVRGLSGFQKRAISTTANAGGQFVAPVWLLDLYAAKLRAGRAYLNALGTRPFVNELGNSINVPSITTGSAVAAGTAENSAITNTDLVTSSIAAATQTISGQTKASYQLIDLSQAGMDDIILDDITRDYTKKLDTFALNSSTTNAKGILQVSGTNAITYTDASPTVPELYPFIFQGKSVIEGGVFAPVDFMVMHPSTWNWALSQLDSNNRPLALDMTTASFNEVAGFDAGTPQGVAGKLAGIPVVVDANVPVNLGGGTNQAPIALVSRLAHDFWEGVPTFKVADQTGISSLQYVFVLYGYAAQMTRQAVGASIVNGTGLIVQSGF